MKKISIIIFAFSILCCFCASCGNQNKQSNTALVTTKTKSEETLFENAQVVNCKLFVNEKEFPTIDTLKMNVDKKVAEVPLLTISKAVGAKIEPKNKNIIYIYFKNNVYELNKNTYTLTLKGDSFNILRLALGAKHSMWFRNTNDDLLVDNDTIKRYVYYVLKARMTIDYKKHIVNILV